MKIPQTCAEMQEHLCRLRRCSGLNSGLRHDKPLTNIINASQGIFKLLTLLILMAVIIIPSVSALQQPTVTMIPQNVSVNSSFIMIVDPKPAASEVVRVDWIVYDSNSYGLFPKIGNKFVCYFSETDPAATCGPSPFRPWAIDALPGGYTTEIRAFNQMGDKENASLNIQAGGIKLSTMIPNPDNKTVSMQVFPSGLVSAVNYDFYYASNFNKVSNKSGALTYRPTDFSYVGNVTLDSLGDYFVAFYAPTADGSNWGGTVSKVSIPISAGELCPGGVPGVSYPIIADRAEKSVQIRKGGSVPITILGLTNTDNKTYNISSSVPTEWSPYVDVTFENSTLTASGTPGARTRYTVRLHSIDSGMFLTTFVDIVNAQNRSQTLGKILLNLTVGVINVTSVSCPTPTVPGTITVTPAVWTGSYAGTGSKTFSVRNNADNTSLSVSFEGDILNVATVDDAPTSIAANSTASITVSAATESAGTYEGTIVLNTASGSVVIPAVLKFYGNFSGIADLTEMSFESYVSGLNNATKASLSGVINDIRSSIKDARDATESGDMETATLKWVAAASQVDTFKTVNFALALGSIVQGGAVPIDMTLVIVIIVVVVAGVAAFFLVKKFLKPGGKTANPKKKREELEKELEEEY